MAIYHCSLRVFTRSKGHSAVAAAAYRAGAKLRDERSGKTHRYQNRKGVAETSSGDTESGGGDDSGGMALKPKSKTREAGDREIDYPVIDAERSRFGFVEEIKALNERRAAFADVRLDVQIEQINNLIDRLDHRVSQYETLSLRTSLPEVVNKLVYKAVKFGKELFTSRQQSRAVVKLNRQERRARAKRQKGRYGRTYRTGLHRQITEMKQNLDTLEQLSSSYKRYQSFIDKIDQELLKHSPSITTPIEKTEKAKPVKRVSNMESSLKLKLQAQMIREDIPAPFRPKPDAPVIKFKEGGAASKITATQEKSIETNRIETTTSLQSKDLSGDVDVKTDVRERAKISPRDRDWFIPARDHMRPFKESVERKLDELERQQPIKPQDVIHDPGTLKGQFNAQGSPEPVSPKATYRTVREKVRVEAISARKQTLPKYRVGDKPKPDQKLSGRFNQVGSKGKDGHRGPHSKLER